MDEDICMNLATSSWGTQNGNGFIGVAFSNSLSSMIANYPRMDPGTAAVSCPATIYLGFKACK